MQLQRVSTGCRAHGCFGNAWRTACAKEGQGTLEYAVVMFAFIAVVLGLGALWRLFDAGVPVQHALQGASHHIASVAPGAFADVFMY